MRRLTTPGATVIVSGILIALFLVVQGCTTPHPPPVVTVTVSTDGCKEGAASKGSTSGKPPGIGACNVTDASGQQYPEFQCNAGIVCDPEGMKCTRSTSGPKCKTVHLGGGECTCSCM